MLVTIPYMSGSRTQSGLQHGSAGSLCKGLGKELLESGRRVEPAANAVGCHCAGTQSGHPTRAAEPCMRLAAEKQERLDRQYARMKKQQAAQTVADKYRLHKAKEQEMPSCVSGHRVWHWAPCCSSAAGPQLYSNPRSLTQFPSYCTICKLMHLPLQVPARQHSACSIITVTGLARFISCIFLVS